VKVRKMIKNHSDTPVVIGFIGHVHPQFLEIVKKQVEEIPDLKIVFYKESSGKLWIVSGDRIQ
jgi:nitrate reductase NapAB chaperone NapD